MAKLPSMQFYPGDWLKDPLLRAASSGARGLWIDMLALMWEAEPRGYLQTSTCKAFTTEQITRMTGNCSLDEVRGWIDELEVLGVFSRSESGAIYSRRLVRDEQKREKCREAGKRGGNPTLKGQSKGEVKGGVKGGVGNTVKRISTPPLKRIAKRNPTPSSSSSSSSSSSDKKKSPLPPLPPELDTDDFRGVWSSWEQHRREIRKPLTPTCIKQQIAKMGEMGSKRAIAAMRHTIAMGWQGLREPEPTPDNGEPKSTKELVDEIRRKREARK